MNTRCVAAWLGCLFTLEALAAETANVRAWRDVGYSAEHREAGCTLDVHAADSEPAMPRPVVLYVHGGAWRHGDKARVGEKPQAFVDKGYAFASANYRLDETVSPREQAQDIAEAVAWLHEHGPEHGCDPARIFLMGHSAGAHLVALVSTDETFLESCGLGLANIAGTILLDGAGYDVPRQIQIARLPRMQEMYREVFSEDPEAQRNASPISHVAAGKGIPPFLMFHVGARQDSREQAEALARRLQDAGSRAEVVHAPDKNHLTLNRDLGSPGDEPTAKILEWLGDACEGRE